MRPSQELGLEASRGSQPAVDELLVRHLPGLRSYVRLKAGPIVRAREAESDVVQSVCREVLLRAGEFRYGGESGFRHWLFTTALRKIIDKRNYHAAGKRDVRRERGAPTGSDQETDAMVGEPVARGAEFASPSGMAIGREQLERLAEAFDDLPEDYREVVLLSRVVGLTRAEVAQEMNRSESSVRNLLHRALAALAAAMDRVGDHGDD